MSKLKFVLLIFFVVSVISCQAPTPSDSVAVVSPTVVTEASSTPTLTPEPTATATATLEPTSTSTPTETPTPTNTPTPTAAPTATPVPFISLAESKIVFVKAFFSGTGWPTHGELWVVNADGTGLYQVLDGENNVPSWSPSGERIAFMRRDDGYPALYIINADGTELRRLLKDRRIFFPPQWLSEDTLLVAIQDVVSGPIKLSTVSVDNGALTPINIEGVESVWYPILSSDGQIFAFMDATNRVETVINNTSSSTNTPVKIASIQGEILFENLFPVPDGEMPDESPQAWSINNELLIAVEQNRQTQCMILNLDTMNYYEIAVDNGTEQCDLVFSPDGAWLASRYSPPESGWLSTDIEIISMMNPDQRQQLELPNQITGQYWIRDLDWTD